jgi:hypothetical protein
MTAFWGRFAFHAALFLICFGYGLPLHAGQIIPNAEPSLVLCNKGTVSVEVVVATRKDDPTRSSILQMMQGTGKYYWSLESVTISPGACNKLPRNQAEPAYIGFGFTDSKGVWGSGKIAQVPDIGSVGRPTRDDLFHEDKVLTAATRVMCARKDATEYSMEDDFQTDCATVKLSGGRRTEAGSGPFLPLTSALLYHPDETQCSSALNVVCSGAAYYLNIAPKPGDRELHATEGSAKGAKNITNPDSEDAFRLKQNPACNVITQQEAEAVLGVSIDAPEPGRTLCRYQEPGCGIDDSKKKQVTIGIFRSAAPDRDAVNARRNFIIHDNSLLPVTYKEVPNLGDAAFWVWAGGYYGALYVLKGGTLEIAVKISGIPQDVALTTARKFAVRALGGTTKTGFVYAARKDK